jgi:hypothetical protein
MNLTIRVKVNDKIRSPMKDIFPEYKGEIHITNDIPFNILPIRGLAIMKNIIPITIDIHHFCPDVGGNCLCCSSGLSPD